VLANGTEAIEGYVKLRDIWMRYNSPCSKEECPICRPEMVKSGSNDNHGDEDGETDGDGDHGHDDHDNGGDDESDGDDGEDGEDDNDDEGDKAGPTHTSHVYHKFHRYETRQSSICPTPWPTTRKASARKASAVDNKSVPYSHREGYTWKNTTANELMARWQGLPYVKKPNGQIIITGISYLGIYCVAGENSFTDGNDPSALSLLPRPA
jgi:hypothetical protein